MGTYDCTSRSHYGKGMNAYQGSYGHGHRRFLGAKKHGGGYAFRGNKGMVQPKVEVVAQTCARTEYAPMETSSRCPADFVASGKGCERISSMPAQMVCSNGGAANACTSFESVPATESCPSGYQMNGSQCFNSISVPMDYFCETGSMVGNRCVTTMPAQQRCSIGFTLRNGVCMGEEKVDV